MAPRVTWTSVATTVAEFRLQIESIADSRDAAAGQATPYSNTDAITYISAANQVVDATATNTCENNERLTQRRSLDDGIGEASTSENSSLGIASNLHKIQRDLQRNEYAYTLPASETPRRSDSSHPHNFRFNRDEPVRNSGCTLTNRNDSSKLMPPTMENTWRCLYDGLPLLSPYFTSCMLDIGRADGLEELAAITRSFSPYLDDEIASKTASSLPMLSAFGINADVFNKRYYSELFECFDRQLSTCSSLLEVIFNQFERLDFDGTKQKSEDASCEVHSGYTPENFRALFGYAYSIAEFLDKMTYFSTVLTAHIIYENVVVTGKSPLHTELPSPFHLIFQKEMLGHIARLLSSCIMFPWHVLHIIYHHLRLLYTDTDNGKSHSFNASTHRYVERDSADKALICLFSMHPEKRLGNQNGVEGSLLDATLACDMMRTNSEDVNRCVPAVMQQGDELPRYSLKEVNGASMENEKCKCSFNPLECDNHPLKKYVIELLTRDRKENRNTLDPIDDNRSSELSQQFFQSISSDARFKLLTIDFNLSRHGSSIH